jgi:hypothetical protein
LPLKTSSFIGAYLRGLPVQGRGQNWLDRVNFLE